MHSKVCTHNSAVSEEELMKVYPNSIISINLFKKDRVASFVLLTLFWQPNTFNIITYFASNYTIHF